MRYKTNINDWTTINWRMVIYEVNRLQNRIAKNVIEKRWRKVKSLQHILTNSFYAKILSIKRVIQNKGGKTAGTDNVIWRTPKQYLNAAQSLTTRGYKPKPLRRIFIKKKNGKTRPLSIPTMHDRAMQALWKIALEPISETTADTNSYGFRPYRSCADAVGQCFLVLAQTVHAQWIVEADIKSCFDKISHEFILENIPIRKDILSKWLKAGYLLKGKRFAMQEGTPQGGIISPTIMNMILDGLEIKLLEKFPRKKGLKVNFIRYADDFIVTAKDKQTAERIVETIKNFLEQRNLELSEEKTKITHINDGFDFLSQNIRKYNGKLIIKPSKASIKSIKNKIRQTCKQYRGQPAYMLISKLNPIIRGWANYHKMIVAKQTFYKLSLYIYDQLTNWIRYNHPNKRRKWIYKRYFSTGRFADIDKKRSKEYRLFSIWNVKIIRHRKLKGKFNPYLQEWKKYIAERKRPAKQARTHY